jgi:hypothetical protein
MRVDREWIPGLMFGFAYDAEGRTLYLMLFCVCIAVGHK